MNHIVAPSILAADFANLAAEVEMINKSEADWIHIDVMDGHFVPNISFGLPIVKAIRRHTKKFLDVHLMISNPDSFLEAFKEAGADGISVHYETEVHLHRTLQHIRQLGLKSGVVLNPHTPVELLQNVLNEVDLILLMSVNPGFGGQRFIPETLNKIKECRKLLDENRIPAMIQVDGGITVQNAASVIRAGANVLVAGSAVFNSENPMDTIKNIKNIQSDNILV